MSAEEQARALFFEALEHLGREDYTAAETRLREAQRLLPKRVSILTNLSAVLLKQDRTAESADCARQALAIDPQNAEALVNLAWCLRKEGKLAEALECCERATALNPDYAQAWSNRAAVLADLERYEDSLESYDKAVALKAPHDVLGDWLRARMQVCHWEGFDQACAAVLAAVDAGERAAAPHVLLAIDSSPAQQRRCAELHALRTSTPVFPARTGERIRIGYASPDMAWLVERHDRARFEVVTDLSGEIDIAVDPTRRVAPVQVSLTYPGTTGARYVDYLIADRVVVPPEQLEHYSEKVVWLPSLPRPGAPIPGGSPAGGFVFCCFSEPARITPDVFEIWMALLEKVEGSVLRLLDHNPGATRNLRAQANRLGVAPERLVFAPTTGLAGHLALDAFYYSGSDALQAGVPMITVPGDTYASRIGASQVRAAGLAELAVRWRDDYEALALSLANDPSRLGKLRERLKAQPFDVDYLEAAYLLMWDRHQRGLGPDHIEVPA